MAQDAIRGYITESLREGSYAHSLDKAPVKEEIRVLLLRTGMSRRLPVPNQRCTVVLNGRGFTVHHVTGSHVLKHPGKADSKDDPTQYSKDMKRGTLASIIDQARFTSEESYVEPISSPHCHRNLVNAFTFSNQLNTMGQYVARSAKSHIRLSSDPAISSRCGKRSQLGWMRRRRCSRFPSNTHPCSFFSRILRLRHQASCIPPGTVGVVKKRAAGVRCRVRQADRDAATLGALAAVDRGVHLFGRADGTGAPRSCAI